jgi:hypothetical protein
MIHQHRKNVRRLEQLSCWREVRGHRLYSIVMHALPYGPNRGCSAASYSQLQLREKIICTASPKSKHTSQPIYRLSDPTLATNTPMTAVASSGAEEPAAMKVAPATSGDSIRANNTREEGLRTITTFIRYQLGRALNVKIYK